MDGTVKLKDKIKMISTGAVYEVTSLGKTTPKIVQEVV